MNTIKTRLLARTDDEVNAATPAPAPGRAASRRLPTLLAVGLAVLASACATSNAPPYVEPAVTEASAKVRVVNVRPYAYYADMAIFDSVACFERAVIGTTGGNARDDVRIGMLGEAPASSASLERHVRAGEPLVIGPRAVYPTATLAEIMNAMEPGVREATRAKQAGVCKIPSFTPKAGEQYEVLVDLSPAHCSITPYRLSESGGAVQRELVKAELSQISTYEFDMKCFK
jgi:hypothetical protein